MLQKRGVQILESQEKAYEKALKAQQKGVQASRITTTLPADGYRSEVCAIDSGLHDLILSKKESRDAAYDTIFSFIRRHLK